MNKLLSFPWKHNKTKHQTNTVVVSALSTMGKDKEKEEEPLPPSNETHQAPTDISLELVPCTICNRTFLPASLLKHSKICEKNSKKKRKVFDSLKQRIEGTELAQFHQKSYLKTKQHEEQPPKQVKNNWKQKHMQLMEAIRAAKGTNEESNDSDNNMKSNKRSSANLGNATNSRCPSCDRNFGPKAYDRHVEWCKEKRTTVTHSPLSLQMAKERLDARRNYKVPPLTKTKKITIKEKYATTPTTQNVAQNGAQGNMKSVSACNLDRSPSVRKSKNSIQRGGDSSQDEYLEKKVGDFGVKQVVSERILKDEKKIQESLLKNNSHKSKLNDLDVNTVQGLTVNSIVKNTTTLIAKDIKKKCNEVETNLKETNLSNTLKATLSLNLFEEKTKPLVKESCSDTICGENIQKNCCLKGLNRFINSKLPVPTPKKSISGPYPTKSPRKSPLNLSPKKNFKSPTIIEVKPKLEINETLIDHDETLMLFDEQNLIPSKTETYDSDYYENKISSLHESLNDIQMINLETSPREEIIFFDDENCKEINSTKNKLEIIYSNVEIDNKNVKLSKSPNYHETSSEFVFSDEETTNNNKKFNSKTLSKSPISQETSISSSFFSDEENLSYHKKSCNSRINSRSKSLDSMTSKDLINFNEKGVDLVNSNDNDESCEKFLEKNRLLSANLKIDSYVNTILKEGKSRFTNGDDLKQDEKDKTLPDYNVKFEININLDKNDVEIKKNDENKVILKDVECQNDSERIDFIEKFDGIDDDFFDNNKINLSQNLIDIDNDLIDFNKKTNEKVLDLNKFKKESCQKSDFGCQFDFEPLKKIKSNINNQKVIKKIKTNQEKAKQQKKFKKIEKTSSDSCGKLIKSDRFEKRKKIKRPKSNVESKIENDKESVYYSDFEANLKRNRRKNMMGGDDYSINQIEMIKLNLTEENYIQIEEPQTLISQYQKINYLDDSKSDLFRNQKVKITNLENNAIIDQYPVLNQVFYDEKYNNNNNNNYNNNYNNNSKGDYKQKILTFETVHVFETGQLKEPETVQTKPKNVEYEKNLESIKENIKIIQENIKENYNNNNTDYFDSNHLVYWRKPNRTGFSESDSVVDGCENHHSHALSCARIERQVRNCCSDLCLARGSEMSFKLSCTEVDLRNYSSYQNIQSEENSLINLNDSPEIIPEKRRKLEKNIEKILKNERDDLNLKKKILETENLLSETTQCETLDLKQVLSTIPESNSDFSTKLEMESTVFDTCSIVTPRFLKILKTVIAPTRNDDEEMMRVSKKHCQKMLLIDKKSLVSVFDEKSNFFLPEITKNGKKVVEKNTNLPKKIVLPEILTSRTSTSSKSVGSSFFRPLDIPNDIVYYRKEGSKSKYDPFVSAERQFMELLECDDFKPFKSTTPTTIITPKLQPKSPKPTQKIHQKHHHQPQKAEKSTPNNKRASVIDPPLDFRDRLSMLNDDFDLIENLINENFTKTTVFHKNNEVNKKNFNEKFSDDLLTNSIDPRLINETDNLSIPDHFNHTDETSPNSTSTLNCFDTFLNGTEIKLNESMSMLDDVSNSFLEDKDLDEVLIALKSPDDKVIIKKCDDKVSEKVSKLPKKSIDKNKMLNSSAGSTSTTKKKNLTSLKRSISLLDPVQKPKPLKNKQDVQNYFNEQENKNGAKVIIHAIEPQKQESLTMAEELFSVDDEMYEEYKKYEEMYLREREEELRKEEIDEENNRNSKISGDSAYGSLTRKSTPKTRARSSKLAPLDNHKMIPDSPSSSSSESSPVPSNVPLKMSKFCHECGSKYPVAAAKFCVECGIKRLVL